MAKKYVGLHPFAYDNEYYLYTKKEEAEKKKLKREKVKEVLLSFRRNLQGTARSECTESRLITFDYV